MAHNQLGIRHQPRDLFPWDQLPLDQLSRNQLLTKSTPIWSTPCLNTYLHEWVWSVFYQVFPRHEVQPCRSYPWFTLFCLTNNGRRTTVLSCCWKMLPWILASLFVRMFSCTIAIFGEKTAFVVHIETWVDQMGVDFVSSWCSGSWSHGNWSRRMKRFYLSTSS